MVLPAPCHHLRRGEKREMRKFLSSISAVYMTEGLGPFSCGRHFSAWEGEPL